MIGRSQTPLGQGDVAAALRRLGVEEGGVLVAHVSLSSIGWVAGGAQAVLQALLDVLGSEGTLVMASQSAQLSDPTYWSDPPLPERWVSEVKTLMPAYDPQMTPTRGMGAVVECLMQSHRAERSPHPLYSFCALGPAAAGIVAEHPLTPSFGDRSPLAKVYEADAQVLLLGVGHDCNTSLHYAEHRARWPGRQMYRSGAPLNIDGATRWVEFQDMIVSTADFAPLGLAFADSGKVALGQVGRAMVQLMRMRELVDFAVPWLERRRG